ncbi:chymotrypsin inhibitor-like [Andrena cerasifolii]|uniref:chymotrypsin inhibitor-like n=1 Tax=Andrena cerasifolii TaxID=2819439 RepID=UPI004037DB14
MSRYTLVLLGLLAVMVAVYAKGEGEYCAANESLNLCGKHCEPTCENPEIPPLCPRPACSNTTAACRCDDNYVRDTNGSCVLYKDCHKNKNKNKNQ